MGFFTWLWQVIGSDRATWRGRQRAGNCASRLPKRIWPQFEVLAERCVPTVIPVTSALDDETLRGTPLYAVSHAEDGDTIPLTPVVSSMRIDLTQGELVLNQDVTMKVVPHKAAPKWFVNLELQITGVMPVGFTQEGLLADVSFGGSAGGPHITHGTVVGVDHAVFDSSGNAHLNIYLTITDKDGDQISAHITGLAAYLNPGQYVLQEASGAIINEPDPHTGALHATTGKYAHMVGDTFEDVGFITSFSFNPPAGSVHVKWYLH